MAFDPRDGLHARKVAINVVPTVDTSSTNFTGSKFEAFWQAYYGDVVINDTTASLVDLGFESGTTFANISSWTAEDTVASVNDAAITLTTNTAMGVNAHVGRGIIGVKADKSAIYYNRVVSNTADALTLETSSHGILATDKVLLLDKVPFCIDTTCYNRIDHIATDFSFEPPEVETNEQFFLGSKDSSGAQNSVLEEENPSPGSLSVTMRGGVVDLMKLAYGTVTSPSGRLRYNMGSSSSKDVSVAVLMSTDFEDPSNSDAMMMGMLFNGVVIKKPGPIENVDSEGRAEMVFEAEASASDIIAEVVEAQHTVEQNK